MNLGARQFAQAISLAYALCDWNGTDAIPITEIAVEMWGLERRGNHFVEPRSGLRLRIVEHDIYRRIYMCVKGYSET